MNAPNEVFTEALHIIKGGDRTSSIIAAAIKTSSLTVNEMGNILGAITDRICATSCGKWPENPELEEVANDLVDICETAFPAAQDKIDERRCNESAEEIEHTEIEEGAWK